MLEMCIVVFIQYFLISIICFINMKLRLFGQGGRTWWYYMYLKSLVLTYRFKWNHRNFGGVKNHVIKYSML